MYEAFFGLRERPFSIQPDPEYLFFSNRHRLAFAMLEYGLSNRAGFSVITGEIGCGKTTLIRHLLNHLEQGIRIGLISNTHKGMTNPLQWVMLAFEQPYEGLSPVALFDAFQHFLIAEYAARRRVVLIIDEAQNLSVEGLEELRMLSNINADKDQLLQIILIGQPQLKALLRQPELEQFAQRVSVDFHIQRLSQAEVGLYILHRLKVAGCERPLFSHEAIMRIAQVSKGVPRSINILCDTALVYAFSQELARVELAVVDEVLSDRRRYGIFAAEGDGPEPDSTLISPPAVKPSAAAGSPQQPALVIYDRELAKSILSAIDLPELKS